MYLYYENFLDFCTFYGIVGHAMTNCKRLERQKTHLNQKPIPLSHKPMDKQIYVHKSSDGVKDNGVKLTIHSPPPRPYPPPI